jgi:hypothetical protein
VVTIHTTRFNVKKSLCLSYSVANLYVPYNAQHKKQLFSYTTLTEWFYEWNHVLCDVCTGSFIFMAIPWLRQLIAGLSLSRPKFDPRPVHVRFVVGKVALGQVFLQVYGFPLSVSFHHCSIHIFILISQGEAGESWEPSNKAIKKHASEHCFHSRP